MTRPGRAVSKPAPYQRWVTLLALLAFFIQGFAVQTHIHEQVPVTKTVGRPADPDQSPAQEPGPG